MFKVHLRDGLRGNRPEGTGCLLRYTGGVVNTADEGAALGGYVLSMATHYWPFMQDRASLVTQRMVTRPASRQYWFQIRAGTSIRSVVVKVPTRIGRPPGSERIPLSPPIYLDHTTRAEREYQALVNITDLLRKIDDDRFGIVLPLDYVKQMNAVITEAVEAPTMKAVFRRVSRLHFRAPPQVLGAALSHAGAWLREYQKLPSTFGSVRSSRDEFLAGVEELCRALQPIARSKNFLDSLPREMDGLARQFLPRLLPLGAAHGDFAQSNVLIGGRGRIFVLDTAAGWNAPVFEDLAYFVVGMECSRLQILTDGSAFSARSLSEARAAFLDGYFGPEGEPHAFRLYELQLALEKWSAELRKVGSGRVGGVKRLVLNRWFRRHCLAVLRRMT